MAVANDAPHRRWAKALLGLLLMAAAAIVTALGPAVAWARARDAANAAANVIADMPPGMTVLISAFVLAPFLLLAIIIELVRVARGGRPLGPLAALLLGVLVGAPIGVQYFGLGLPFGWFGLSAWFCLALAGFHAARSRV